MKYIAPFNASTIEDKSFEYDGLQFIEMCRQEYAGNNCAFSAGMIDGHEIEEVYLKWGKDGDEGGLLMLRADELAAIAWVANGALWGELYTRFENARKETD